MLPQQITPDMPESERRRWRIVRSDTFADLPGGLIVQANVTTGVAVLVRRDCNGAPVSTNYSLGPDGFRIIGARR
jgi:hypothetical protein